MIIGVMSLFSPITILAAEDEPAKTDAPRLTSSNGRQRLPMADFSATTGPKKDAGESSPSLVRSTRGVTELVTTESAIGMCAVLTFNIA